MQHLTIIQKVNGPLSEQEIRRLTERVIRFGPYPDWITQRASYISDDRCSIALWFSNEPGDQPPSIVGEKHITFALGYPLPDPEAMASIRPDRNMHRQIGMMSGRFSAVTFDRNSGNSYCAVPIARQDSIYYGLGKTYCCVGNWSSSVAAAIQDGTIEHEDEKLFGFLNSGHFTGQETFYRGVSALSAYSTVEMKGGTLSVSSEAYELFRRSIESDTGEELFDTIADALVQACNTAQDLASNITLNLSGGKDSRLLLAAFTAADYKVEGRTYSGGSSNSSDVYVAGLVARAAGIEHVIRPYAKSPLAGETSTSVDFYARTHGLLRASDASVVAWVNQTYNPRFRDRVVLNGLGGELMRGGHASKADQIALAKRPPTSTLLKRWGKFSPAFNARLQDEFTRQIAGWLDNFTPHSLSALEVADFGYVDVKLGRWGSAISRPGDLAHKVFYPFLDNRLTTLIYSLPPHLRMGDSLIHYLTKRLDPRLVDIPIAYDSWKCDDADAVSRLHSMHPQAFVPRGAGEGKNTDWRINWLQLLPEMKRLYLERADPVLREMVDDAEVLRLLNGDAVDNDRYLLFSIYAATIVRSGGLERETEHHPMQITL